MHSMLLISACAILSAYCLFNIYYNNKKCKDNNDKCEESIQMNKYYTNLLICNLAIISILLLLNNPYIYVKITNRSGLMYTYIIYAILLGVIIYNLLNMKSFNNSIFINIGLILFLSLCVYYIYAKIEYRRNQGYDTYKSGGQKSMSLPRSVYAADIGDDPNDIYNNLYVDDMYV